MSAILTVRLTDEEKRILLQRSRRAGMKKATFVRQLITQDDIATGADALAWSVRESGNQGLRIKPRK